MPLGTIPQIALTQGGVDMQSLFAVGYDPTGNVVPFVQPVVWASDNPLVCQPGSIAGSFGEQCQITGGTAGVANLTASSGGVSATAVVTVAAPPPPPPPPPPVAPTQMSIEVGTPATPSLVVKHFRGVPRK